MDEEKGHEIGYVQYPQSMMKVKKNDLYGNSLNVIFKVCIIPLPLNPHKFST